MSTLSGPRSIPSIHQIIEEESAAINRQSSQVRCFWRLQRTRTSEVIKTEEEDIAQQNIQQSRDGDAADLRNSCVQQQQQQQQHPPLVNDRSSHLSGALLLLPADLKDDEDDNDNLSCKRIPQRQHSFHLTNGGDSGGGGGGGCHS